MSIWIEMEEKATFAKEISRRLLEYNQGHSDQFKGKWRPLQIFARDDSGELIGGIDCKTKGLWLEIGPFWIDEIHRGQGLGTRMMDQVESEARERGCRKAFVDTFSFQAPDFYERTGYTICGTVTDYPPGHAYHLLIKDL
jgi:GNAT superfamily N-acetyltransferase